MKLKMSLRHWTPVALILGCSAPALSPAQAPQQNSGQKPPENNAIGGKLSVDLMFVKQDAMGIPMRHAGVIAGSEEISLNGRKLKRGDDYTIDNEAGIIYLLCPNKPGQSVSVSYRYEPSRAHAGEAVGSAG